MNWKNKYHFVKVLYILGFILSIVCLTIPFGFLLYEEYLWSVVTFGISLLDFYLVDKLRSMKNYAELMSRSSSD